MSNEKEKISRFHSLPQVSLEAVNNPDDRFVWAEREKQEAAIKENDELFLFFAANGLPVEGAYIVYIPLMIEAKNQKLELPKVHKKTIDSYLESPIWGKINEFFDERNEISREKLNGLKKMVEINEIILPTTKLPKENPHLNLYLNWHCEVLQNEGLNSSEVEKIKKGGHIAYDLLSLQLEKDNLPTSFSL